MYYDSGSGFGIMRIFIIVAFAIIIRTVFLAKAKRNSDSKKTPQRFQMNSSEQQPEENIQKGGIKRLDPKEQQSRIQIMNPSQPKSENQQQMQPQYKKPTLFDTEDDEPFGTEQKAKGSGSYTRATDYGKSFDVDGKRRRDYRGFDR